MLVKYITSQAVEFLAQATLYPNAIESKARDRQQGVTIAASPLGKSKTVAQIVCVALLILGHQLGVILTKVGLDGAVDAEILGKVALWFVVTFSLISGVDYFMKFSRAVFGGKR